MYFIDGKNSLLIFFTNSNATMKILKTKIRQLIYFCILSLRHFFASRLATFIISANNHCMMEGSQKAKKEPSHPSSTQQQQQQQKITNPLDDDDNLNLDNLGSFSM